MTYLANLKKIVIALFLILLCGGLIYTNMTRKTVLILHSYDDSYAWIRDLNTGIDRALGNKKNIRIFRHYMNTKNHPDTAYKEKAGAIARRVVDYLQPDIVLASDDDAQEYVMKYYVNHENMQIVFTAVNGDPTLYGYHQAKNVTGVLERIPYEAIKEVIRLLAEQRGLKAPYRVTHISDQSIIVGYDDINLHKYPDWAPIHLLKSKRIDTFEEWKKAILDSPQFTDFILISNYRKVYEDETKKKFVPFKEVIKWSYENSKVPLIGVNGFVCEEGAALSIATSPIEQGEVAARIVLSLLNGGVKAKDIPFQISPFPMVYMDENRFNQSGFKLPQIYTAFAKAANNFYESNPLWGQSK